VKPAMLCCLVLLSGCWPSEEPPTVYEYALTWTCRSPEGCERTDEVQRIDRMEEIRRDCHFTSTQEESFRADAKQVLSDFLPEDCLWLYFLTLFDHELERSRICFIAGGFELELAIPNQDPTAYSMWLVEGRNVNLL
jgi:hypothetical protein